MISQFGVVTNAANINGKNAASVIVTAELPPFVKPGQRLDIVVSTAGQQLIQQYPASALALQKVAIPLLQ